MINKFFDDFYYNNILSLKIAVIIEGNIPSVSIGIISPLEQLKINNNIIYDLFIVGDIIRGKVSIEVDNYDCVLFLRVMSKESIDKILIPFMKKNKKIIYMIDDDFENIPSGSLESDFYLSLNPKENIRIFCEKSNHVMVSSKTLFDKYKVYNKNITIVPGFIDFKKINSYLLGRNDIDDDGLIKIGYSATERHYNNLKVCMEPLKDILIKYKDVVKFECYFNEIPQELCKLENVCLLKQETNLNNFYKSLSNQNWDIGLAPLEDNEFNKSKSNLKYREYSAFKIAGIYSDCLAYSSSIQNNHNGLLINNNHPLI